MTCKTIVLHLDNGARCASRIELAARLADRFGARLLGIAPSGLPDVIVTMNTAVPDAIECVALSAAALRENAEVAARHFEQRCRAAGLASFESHVEIGEAVEAVVRWGRCSDLIVVGQTDRSTRVDGLDADLPQQVLLQSGTPVLAVPYAGTFATLGRNVLAGWKNTREAARALRDGLPLMGGAAQVTLLEIGEMPAPPDAGESLAAAAAWMQSHGLPVRTQRDLDIGDAGDQLLSRASEFGVDLIVMGGYGHSRLRQWVLGGVTRHLLQNMTVPTLLSH